MFQELRPAPGLSVAEAAEQLGVNEARVRRLIGNGELNAVKLGGRWVVDPASVERRRRLAAPRGRQFSAERAFGLLMLAAGEPAPWLDRVSRWKLMRELQRAGLRNLVPRLKDRAEVLRLRAHPSSLARIARESDVVLSGPSASGELSLGIVAPDLLEAYVAEDRLKRLARTYRPGRSSNPNLILHVVPGLWPFDADRRVVPLSIAAIDLLESDDPRIREAGLAVLRRVEAQ